MSYRKTVEVSFGGALKLWVAVLIIRIIVAMIIFFPEAVICGAFNHTLLQGLLESLPQTPTSAATLWKAYTGALAFLLCPRRLLVSSTSHKIQP